MRMPGQPVSDSEADTVMAYATRAALCAACAVFACDVHYCGDCGSVPAEASKVFGVHPLRSQIAASAAADPDSPPARNEERYC
jgi:hypothetical protein